MSNSTIYINGLRRSPQGFLQYMNQFVEAGERAGFHTLKTHTSPKHLFRRVMPFFFYLTNLLRLGNLRSKPLIITSRGDGILEAAFPYYLSYHIIPMLWDTWPKEQERLYGDLKMLKCPMALVSSRQMAQQIEKRLHIKCLWVPEGIDAAGFSKGDDLYLRPIDVFELGRQHAEYHKAGCHPNPAASRRSQNRQSRSPAVPPRSASAIQRIRRPGSPRKASVPDRHTFSASRCGQIPSGSVLPS